MENSCEYLDQRNINLRDLGANRDSKVTPTDNYIRTTENLEQKEYRLRTDDDGYIIGKNNLKTEKDSVEILFFGGSTTECLYVEESKRFPYLVQESLSELLKKRITTLNGGVSGNNAIHSTLNLIAKGIHKKPKTIILMHNINDLAGLKKTGSYYNQPYSRMPVQKTINTSSLKARIRHLKNALIPNVYFAFRDMIFSSNVDVDEWNGFRNKDTIPSVQIENEFEKSISSFISIAKSHNIDVILMTQFNRINMSDEKIIANNMEVDSSFISMYHKLNEKIREIASKEQVGIIDLAKDVPSNNMFIYDMVHLNTNGSEHVANIITNYLYEKNYLN
jgi:lysophospholipase L1-like esterase